MKKSLSFFLIGFLSLGLIFGLTGKSFAAGTVTSATGGTNISVDTVAAVTYTALTLPTLTCGAIGDIANGSTITITAPAGFNFKTTALSVTATPSNEINLGGGAATQVTITPGLTTITIPVTIGNTLTAAATIGLAGIEVIPTSGTPASGELAVTFSAGSFGNDASSGSLSSIAGNLAHWSVVTQHAGTETAGTSFTLTVTAQDQYNNQTTKQTDGTALGAESFGISTTATSQGGNDPTYAAGAFPAAGVALNMATGQATSGAVLLYDADEADPTISVTADSVATIGGTSAAIVVDPAVANKLTFTTQPSPSTIVANVAFTIKPVVTIQDTYGNTRVADSDEVTLSGYSDAGCTVALAGLGGTLAMNAVNGVANFTALGTKFTNSTNTLYLGATVVAPLNAACTTPVITVNPAAPTLICASSGQAGAIWLSWTIPYGVKAAGATYEGQYHSGNAVTWDGAGNVAFGTTWVTGTPGASAQELVTGMNTLTQYSFRMHTLGNNALESADSNLVTCSAPSSSGAPVDSVAPTSYITSPAMNAVLLAGQDIVIKGTARDTGGSSAQKVEVSTDGGTNWSNATVTSNVDGNLIWEYTWVKPAVGSYTIKTRATDWVSNVETVGAGITVTTSNTATTTTTVTTLKPISEMTVAEKATFLVTLRSQLVTLLQQLVLLLTAKLQALLIH